MPEGIGSDSIDDSVKLKPVVEEIGRKISYLKDFLESRPIESPDILTVLAPHRSLPIDKDNEMEKCNYLDSFLKRAQGNARSLDDLVQLIINSEAEIRDFYDHICYRYWEKGSDGTLVFRQDKELSPSRTDEELAWFIQMILVDAGFILELFWRAYHDGSDFLKPGNIQKIREGLFDLDNQLPFSILNKICGVAFPNGPYFVVLASHFFLPCYNQKAPIDELMKPRGRGYREKLEKAKHLTDFLRTIQLPITDHSVEKHPIPSCTFKVVMHNFINRIRSSSNKPEVEDLEQEASTNNVQGEYLYSAVLLQEAGVKFKMSSGRCLADITFNKNNGELEIPPLKIDLRTKLFLLTLIDLERRYYKKEARICEYVYTMGYLIKSAQDVDLLVRKRVIINQLPSHDVVKSLFYSLCQRIALLQDNTCSDLYKEINAYTAVRHHNWRATLCLEYFSNIWKGSATIAAVVLLVLTLIQTICSVLQVL